MKKDPFWKLITIGFLTLMLVACVATLGPQATWNDQIGAAEKANTEVLVLSTTSLQAGKITLDRDRQIRKITDSVDLGLRTANALHGTDPVAAEVQLAALLAQIAAMKQQTTGVAP